MAALSPIRPSLDISLAEGGVPSPRRSSGDSYSGSNNAWFREVDVVYHMDHSRYELADATVNMSANRQKIERSADRLQGRLRLRLAAIEGSPLCERHATEDTTSDSVQTTVRPWAPRVTMRSLDGRIFSTFSDTPTPGLRRKHAKHVHLSRIESCEGPWRGLCSGRRSDRAIRRSPRFRQRSRRALFGHDPQRRL